MKKEVLVESKEPILLNQSLELGHNTKRKQPTTQVKGILIAVTWSEGANKLKISIHVSRASSSSSSYPLLRQTAPGLAWAPFLPCHLHSL